MWADAGFRARIQMSSYSHYLLEAMLTRKKKACRLQDGGRKRSQI